MMETSTDTPRLRSYERSYVVSELKRDFRFALLYLLPNLYPDCTNWHELAAKIQLPEPVAADLVEKLFATKLWQVRDEQIMVERDHLDLGDLNISEFMTMSLNLIARMNEDGPCWYETLFVITNEQLKKDFYQKINRALREFIEASRGTKGDSVVAWNHCGLDCLNSVTAKGN